MSALKSLLSRIHLSARHRIFGGFSVVMLLLVLLAAISLRNVNVIEVRSDDVGKSALIAGLIGNFAGQVDDARARLIQYALSENDGDLQSVHV